MSMSPAPQDETCAAPVMDRSSVAHVSTESPSRYAEQLAAHMSHKITTSWDEGTQTGALRFARQGRARGNVDISVQEGTLVLTLHAGTDTLEELEYVTGIHLARFGIEDQLAVSWTRDDGSQGTAQGPLSPEDLAELRARREARLAKQAQPAPGQVEATSDPA